MLCRFWTTNRGGHCLAETCHAVEGDIVHLLTVCPALEQTRHRLRGLWCTKTVSCPPLYSLILTILGSTPDTQVRFILDARACPDIILLKQIYGQEMEDMVLYLTRTWAYTIHRQKIMLLGRWPEATSLQKRLDSQENTARLNKHSLTTDNYDTTDNDNTYPNRNNNSILAGLSGHGPTGAAPASGSLSLVPVCEPSMTSLYSVPASTTTSSQRDQSPVPAPAPGSNYYHHQSGSSEVEKDGDQGGGGEGHMAAGCGGDASFSY